MRTYKVVVVTPFRDQHTDEKYDSGLELNVSEKRAFELFSSPSHLVKFVSCDGEEDLESIKTENDALKAENAALKTNVDNLTSDNEKLNADITNVKDESNTLKVENDALKAENESLKKSSETTNIESDKNKDKEQNKKN